MKLDETTLPNRAERKLQFEDLDDDYFVDSRDLLEVDNILKLLNENICSFQEIVDRFKNIKDEDDDPYLYGLLLNEELFEKLIQNDQLTKNDLRYLLNRIDESNELSGLTKNTILLKYIVDKNIVSFKELVDKYKNTKDEQNKSCLYKLLRNKKLFQELLESNILTQDELKYLLNRIDEALELNALNSNIVLFDHIVHKNILSFKELIDKFKHNSRLYILLDNHDLFKELIKNNRLNKDDLRYLLNRINNDGELINLVWNTSLIERISNEFVLNKELVARLNRLLENSWYTKDNDISTIFDVIEYHYKNEYLFKELVQSIRLNQKVYSFDLNEEQKLELIELIKNNEISRNRLKELADNNLENNYDFDSLMRYLKKPEKKNILNI